MIGCFDTDGDGYADLVDNFELEPSQWSDSDEDGFGDNSRGYQGDDCIFTSGSSFQDRTGCLDSDGDGWSDPDASWLSISGADAFPLDESQHSDQDSDGFGDQETGFQADVCPNTAGSSTEDRFGCLDTDGDGWSDLNDAFADDSTQYADQDMDGYGDSSTGNQPDSCPQVYGLSSQQKFGCLDADGDGWSDEIDTYQDDIRFWSDFDGDNYPDQLGTNISDDCPEISGTSSQDLIGCLDSDGDGWSDEADVYPMDATRHLSEDSSSTLTLILIVSTLVVLVIVGLLFVSRRQNDHPSEKQYVANQIQPLASPIVANEPIGPPLPPDGLPPGWTMEQWAWYGEDYLKYR